MADLGKDCGRRVCPLQQLGDAVYAFGGSNGGVDVGTAVHASADFDGAEYGGKGWFGRLPAERLRRPCRQNLARLGLSIGVTLLDNEW